MICLRKILYGLPALICIFLLNCNQLKNNEIATADRQATTETQHLHAGMKQLTISGIMIGHQDDLAYGVGWMAPNGRSDIYRICSDYPAVFGWDLGHMENGSAVNLDSVPFAEMKAYSLQVHSLGAINTFSWHCNNPLTGGSAWDTQTPGVVASILPGGERHAAYRRWLDRLAEFFNGLTDDNNKPIPLIFRPFHEQTGDWFWWGRSHCTPDEFIRIWRFTVEYLNETKQVHNLLWAYSASDRFEQKEDFMERYPGDRYVDIVGFDQYQQAGQSNEDFMAVMKRKTSLLVDLAKEHDKLPAITEMGYEQIPYPAWWTHVVWPILKDSGLSYALFWRNAADRPNHYYVPYPGQISEENFVLFYDLPRTLFQKDIQDMNLYTHK
ncbi:MAG: glycosyl hydrolase [Bacteroidales bacterium]|nr:glycosyl hydrolase [Bacteroidales bacterium]